MKKLDLLMVMVLLLFPSSIMAQMLPNVKQSVMEQILDHHGTKFLQPIPKSFIENSVQADAESVELTIEISGYSGRQMVQTRVFNESASFYIYTKDKETITVPFGIYDVISLIWRNDGENGSKQNPCFVIKEQVDVNKDMSIVLSSDMADQRIHVKNYGPDGEELKFPLGHVDWDAMEWIVDEKGDVDVTQCEYKIFLKGTGFVFGLSAMCADYFMEEDADYRTLKNYDWFVNSDVSNRFLFTQMRTSINDETNNCYVSYFSTDNVKCDILENNPQDYVINRETWKFTPDGNERFGGGYMTEVSYTYNDLFEENAGLGVFNPELEKNTELDTYVYVNVPAQDPIDNQLKLFMSQTFYDGADYDEETGFYDYENNTAYSPYYQYENGEKRYAGLGLHSDLINPNVLLNVATNRLGTKEMMQRLTENNAFSVVESDKIGILGENCPINYLVLKSAYNERTGSENAHLNPAYIGRFGETRWCDKGGFSWEAKCDGEVLETIEEWNAQKKGVYDVAFFNKNVEVDGLQGENATSVHYDTRNEDCFSPSLTMLQMRNSDRKVVDRFATGNDGKIELSAADFNYQFMVDYHDAIYECKQITTNVYYSPYKKNEWAALEVEEIPENFFMPGFGYFYRGSLKDVTGAGEKGWFDLKIRLEDAAGNWQEQVISPAFRIDDLVDTGISQLTNDNGQLTISGNETVYDVMGRRVADKSSKAMKGIQIVRRQNGDVRKVVVR